MRGGAIHTDVPGGTQSHQAIRRLHIEQAPFSRILTQPITYQAEDELDHATGRRLGDGWQATPNEDEAGYLVFGPYAHNWGEGQVSVDYRLLIDSNREHNDDVLHLEVYDADEEEVLVQHTLKPEDFESAWIYQSFVVNVDLAGRLGHRLESRVYWKGRSFIRIDSVQVRPK